MIINLLERNETIFLSIRYYNNNYNPFVLKSRTSIKYKTDNVERILLSIYIKNRLQQSDDRTLMNEITKRKRKEKKLCKYKI